MKILLLVLMLTAILINVQGQKSIYEYEIATADGKQLTMSGFKGSKILIVVASPEQPEKGVKEFLDLLQKAYPAMVAIEVHSPDLGGSRHELMLAADINDNSQSKLLMASLAAVTKTKDPQQNSLFQWLSNNTLRGHFEANVVDDVEFYVVDQSGELNSVLEKGVPPEVITALLIQEDVKE